MTPKEAADWAAIAYKGAAEGATWAAERGFRFFLFSRGPHQCCVGQKDGVVVVSFRGTEMGISQWKDLLTNFKAAQVRFLRGKAQVHKGYYDAVWQLLPLIKPLLRETLFVTGHSMGGALGVLAGAILKADGVYSFNAPKPGDLAFRKTYPVPIYRFESRNDWIPWFPTDSPDWHPVGHQILLESRGHHMDNICALFSGVLPDVA